MQRLIHGVVSFSSYFGAFFGVASLNQTQKELLAGCLFEMLDLDAGSANHIKNKHDTYFRYIRSYADNLIKDLTQQGGVHAADEIASINDRFLLGIFRFDSRANYAWLKEKGIPSLDDFECLCRKDLCKLIERLQNQLSPASILEIGMLNDRLSVTISTVSNSTKENIDVGGFLSTFCVEPCVVKFAENGVQLNGQAYAITDDSPINQVLKQLGARVLDEASRMDWNAKP